MSQPLSPQDIAGVRAKYAKLKAQGLMRTDPHVAAWGHRVRARGLVDDPSQGGKYAVGADGKPLVAGGRMVLAPPIAPAFNGPATGSPVRPRPVATQPAFRPVTAREVRERYGPRPEGQVIQPRITSWVDRLLDPARQAMAENAAANANPVRRENEGAGGTFVRNLAHGVFYAVPGFLNGLNQWAKPTGELLAAHYYGAPDAVKADRAAASVEAAKNFVPFRGEIEGLGSAVGDVAAAADPTLPIDRETRLRMLREAVTDTKNTGAHLWERVQTDPAGLIGDAFAVFGGVKGGKVAAADATRSVAQRMYRIAAEAERAGNPVRARNFRSAAAMVESAATRPLGRTYPPPPAALRTPKVPAKTPAPKPRVSLASANPPRTMPVLGGRTLRDPTGGATVTPKHIPTRTETVQTAKTGGGGAMWVTEERRVPVETPESVRVGDGKALDRSRRFVAEARIESALKELEVLKDARHDVDAFLNPLLARELTGDWRVQTARMPLSRLERLADLARGMADDAHRTLGTSTQHTWAHTTVKDLRLSLEERIRRWGERTQEASGRGHGEDRVPLPPPAPGAMSLSDAYAALKIDPNAPIDFRAAQLSDAVKAYSDQEAARVNTGAVFTILDAIEKEIQGGRPRPATPEEIRSLQAEREAVSGSGPSRPEPSPPPGKKRRPLGSWP